MESLLRDKTRKPRTPPISRAKVGELVELAVGPPPGGETHWTVRALAAEVGNRSTTAQCFLARHKLAPHRLRHFKVSTGPNFAEKTRDVMGLYMDPPDLAIMLSINEKMQIQALDRIKAYVPAGRNIHAILNFIELHSGKETKPFKWTASPERLIAARQRGNHKTRTIY